MVTIINFVDEGFQQYTITGNYSVRGILPEENFSVADLRYGLWFITYCSCHVRYWSMMQLPVCITFHFTKWSMIASMTFAFNVVN